MTLKSIFSVDRAMGWSGAGLLVGLALAAGCSPSTPPSATGPSGPVADVRRSRRVGRAGRFDSV